MFPTAPRAQDAAPALSQGFSLRRVPVQPQGLSHLTTAAKLSGCSAGGCQGVCCFLSNVEKDSRDEDGMWDINDLQGCSVSLESP